MIKLSYFIAFLILINVCNLYAQEVNYEHRKDSTFSDVRFYGGLTHDHLNFFNKAFSFQGIETGVTIHHKYLVGAYGSTFITNLEIEQAHEFHYYFISQAGLVVGMGQKDTKFISLGMLLKAGYVSIVGDNYNFTIFNDRNPKINVSGIIITPQVYAAINATKWMKIRTGVGYNIYQIKSQPTLKKSDLQNFSINFGFLFGKFN